MEYEGWKTGQALRNVRKSRHLTIEQLSERVNKSPSHINQIELGSRKMSVDLLYLLMTALHTDANTILGIISEEDRDSAITDEVNDGVVDQKLRTLSPQQKKYFEAVFCNMIDAYPA